MPAASTSNPPTARSRTPSSVIFATALLVLFSATLIALPLAGIAASLIAKPPTIQSVDSPGAWSLLLQTLIWAAGIGLCAALLAIPAACVLRARGWALAPVLLVPLTLPTYFVYSALGLARAPGTLLGDWIELAAQRGSKDIPLIVGKVLASAGLSLWAWPIAAMVMTARWRAIDQTVLDSLRLEQAGPLRRGWELARLGRAGFTLGAAAVALVMLGSAVPLHLAQVRTFALEVWSILALRPGDLGVWLTASPLVVVALGVGWWLSGAACGNRPQEVTPTQPRESSRTTTLATALIWALAAILPLALFALSIRSRASFDLFLRFGAEALWGSLLVAAAVGAIAIVITCLSWLALADSRSSATRAALRVSLFLWLVGGLLPGVLVGSSLLTALNAIPLLRSLPDSPWVLVLGHLARYGCIPALIGTWLAAAEPAEQRSMRRLDGAVGLVAWAKACLPGQAGIVIASGIAVACLSLHEIESSIILQPPGVPSLAQMLLGYLHFAKTEEMSVAAVLLVGCGLLVAVAAALAASIGVRQTRPIEPVP